MTNWKEQIDRELGTERKFHERLEREILARTKQKKRKPAQLHFVATLIGACVVALLLVLTLPQDGRELPQQQADVLLMNDKLKQDFDVFYLSHVSSKNDQFLARPSSFAYGTERFSGKDNVQMLSVVLREAVLAEEVVNAHSKDLIVRFDSGELMKLKLYNHLTWLGLYDVDTGLYYTVEGAAAEQLIEVAFGSRFNVVQMFIFVALVQLALVYLPRYMKVEPKRVDKAFGYVVLLAIPASFILPMWNIILTPWLPMAVLFLYYSWRAWQLQRAGEVQSIVKLNALYAIILPLIWAIAVAIF